MKREENNRMGWGTRKGAEMDGERGGGERDRQSRDGERGGYRGERGRDTETETERDPGGDSEPQRIEKRSTERQREQDKR